MVDAKFNSFIAANEFINSFGTDESVFVACCGLHYDTFGQLFKRYCGYQTRINKPQKLFNLFKYLKQYPVERALQLEFNQRRTPGHIYTDLNEMMDYFADVSHKEIVKSWQARKRPENRLPNIVPYAQG